jgi:hypothetical protein
VICDRFEQATPTERACGACRSEETMQSRQWSRATGPSPIRPGRHLKAPPAPGKPCLPTYLQRPVRPAPGSSGADTQRPAGAATGGSATSLSAP